MGKVPTLRHGATVVTEGAAICAYLADAFPEAGLAPPHGDRLRGLYYRWLFFAAGPLEAAWSNHALGFVVPPERKRMIGYGNFAAVLDTLERAVSQGPYLAGDTFTAADLYVGSQLGFGLQFGMIEKRSAFVEYVGRLSARPAAVRAKQIDDALTPQQQS
jgi:glutathione S-transferase